MKNNLYDIKDNVTVITGGTGVLGRAIARYLAHEGAKVIILGRKEDVGREIVESVMAEKPAGTIEFMKKSSPATAASTPCSTPPAAT